MCVTKGPNHLCKGKITQNSEAILPLPPLTNSLLSLPYAVGLTIDLIS